MIVELFEQDIDEIMDFEKAAFAAEIQATKATYQKRLGLGHIMLGYRPDRLRGLISFSYGVFDPRDPSTIPAKFYEWSTQPVPAQFDTMFIYNLGLMPGVRGTVALRALVLAAIKRGMRDGCRQAVAEGPIPSYAGNGHVQCIPEIKECLRSYSAGNTIPPSELLFRDPHLALYRRLCRCSIIRVIPEFLPSDAASGGFRAMLFRDLRDFQLGAAG